MMGKNCKMRVGLHRVFSLLPCFYLSHLILVCFFPVLRYPGLLLLMHWEVKWGTLEICRLTMEDSCSCCISLSWAELVVQALAPFPPHASLIAGWSRHSNTPRGKLSREGGKTKHDRGFVWQICDCFLQVAQHVLFTYRKPSHEYEIKIL